MWAVWKSALRGEATVLTVHEDGLGREWLFPNFAQHHSSHERCVGSETVCLEELQVFRNNHALTCIEWFNLFSVVGPGSLCCLWALLSWVNEIEHLNKAVVALVSQK